MAISDIPSRLRVSRMFSRISVVFAAAEEKTREAKGRGVKKKERLGIRAWQFHPLHTLALLCATWTPRAGSSPLFRVT